MSRYIRTKDGVYDTNKYHYEIEIDVLYEIVWDDPYTEYGVNGKYSRGKVIAQSENLEELCDEGVTEVKFSSTGYIAHFNKNIDDLRKFLKYLKECQPITKDEILNVYGAIWTDKGLIYVAKMNENGELVLI